jgi:hypothetical protein
MEWMGKDQMGEGWLRRGVLWGLSLWLLGACSNSTLPSNAPAGSTNAGITPTAISVSPTPQKTLEYQVYTLPRSTVYTIKIPPDSLFEVVPAVSETVKTLEELARRNQAVDQSQVIAAINGGFFDPQNQKSTSPIFLQGQQVVRPEDNERLMTNPDLLPYLDRILNRTEFRRYRCGSTWRYAIARRQELPPADCQLDASLGGGPRLLPDLTLAQEGFLETQNGKVVRDSLGYNQPNARSAVGLTADGSVLLVMVAQKPNVAPPSGMTLPELADFMKSLKIEAGMNLDGGSSSALYYGGKTFWGKVNETGEPVQRPIKSALLVKTTKKQKPETESLAR